MKKIILFVPLIFCLFLSSCQRGSYGILSYQEKNIEAECTLNGEYKILVTKEKGAGSIRFLEPSELSSISFLISGEEIIAKSEDVEIPLAKENAYGTLAIFNMFSLSEGELYSAKQEGEYSKMEFLNDYGLYQLTLGKNSMPKAIKIVSSDYTFDISIDAILLK